MKQQHFAAANRGYRSLLVLAILLSCMGCRAVRARNLDERLDDLENRVTAVEAQLSVQRVSE